MLRGQNWHHGGGKKGGWRIRNSMFDDKDNRAMQTGVIVKRT